MNQIAFWLGFSLFFYHLNMYTGNIVVGYRENLFEWQWNCLYI